MQEPVLEPATNTSLQFASHIEAPPPYAEVRQQVDYDAEVDFSGIPTPNAKAAIEGDDAASTGSRVG